MKPMIWRILAVVMIVAMAGHRYATVRRPVSAEDYFQHIRATGATVPSHAEGWVGVDVPVAAQAVQVLHPNLLVSRRYTNVENGLTAGFLLVHCSDAHDMAGHFPPRCYPAAGWDMKAARPVTFNVAGLRLDGYEYEFTRSSLDGQRAHGSITVVNTLLRPGGRVFADMAAMTESIIGAGGQSSGAAQIQVTFDGAFPADRRDAAVEALVGSYRAVVDAVLSTPRPGNL